MSLSFELPLVVNNLTRYHRRAEPSMSDISLTLEPGQILLVAGTRGCGKTTLMRCINGLAPVTMEAILAGEDIANAMDLRCFGLKKRTWVEALKFQQRDLLMIGLSLVILIASLVIRLGYPKGDFWFPM